MNESERITRNKDTNRVSSKLSRSNIDHVIYFLQKKITVIAESLRKWRQQQAKQR